MTGIDGSKDGNPQAGSPASGGPEFDSPSTEVQARFEATILKIARLIGRQIAREEFAKRIAHAAANKAAR